jgi:hypothetical protein
MTSKFTDRVRIDRKARALVGLKKQSTPQDRDTYLQQCVDQMMESGETDDEDRAVQICNLLWDELESYGGESYAELGGPE